MTLIELLVSIVILVTVLGAVIPVISPNNNARRIRQGARQLQSMLSQAQALAAREGRPYGVAFREIGVDADGDSNTGVNGLESGDATALEAYLVSEPKPYAGFSEYSRVRLSPQRNGPADQVLMQFVLAGPPTGKTFPEDLVEDSFPPNLIRRGDRIFVNGVTYRIIDLDREGDGNEWDEATFPEGDYYTLDKLKPGKFWRCAPENPRPPIPIDVTTGVSTPRPYKFLRQTASLSTRPGNTSAPPLIMPRDVAIDLVASGTDVIFPDPALALSPQFGLTTRQSNRRTALINDGKFYPFLRPLTVSVMFAPSGRVDSMWINGEKLQGSTDHMYLLVGRAENSLRTSDDKAVDADMSTCADDSELLERRQRLNWLNGDSMWVTVAARTGRILASDNDISTDPRLYSSDTVLVQIAKQVRDAREFAQEMNAPAKQ